MLSLIKKKWKFSKLRFYTLNALWNYHFWLNCTKEYKKIEYYHLQTFRSEPVLKSKKRFIGYKYKGVIYLDNPGLQVSEFEVWKHWHKKGLL